MKIKKLSLLVTSLFLLINLTPSCSEPKEKIVIDEVVKEKIFSIFNESDSIVKTRFNPPIGYTRVEATEGSFDSYLQNLPLKEHGSKVYHFDGTLKANTSAYCAVVDLPFRGNKNYQCADAVMRLRADYLFSQKRFDEIEFLYVSGKKLNYLSYLEGKTPSTDNLWSYLCLVFSYANTYSLNKQLKSKSTNDLEIGNVFIIGGFPGHVVIVVDKCRNAKGEVKFMLAQSYMPAQDIQILVGDHKESPWYDLNFGEILNTPEFQFSKNDFKSF